eukprot:3923751-Ditylum_brightwellii.AAC.1
MSHLSRIMHNLYDYPPKHISEQQEFLKDKKVDGLLNAVAYMNVFLEEAVPMFKQTVTSKSGSTNVPTAGSNQLENAQLASYLLNQQEGQQLGQLAFLLNHVFNQDTLISNQILAEQQCQMFLSLPKNLYNSFFLSRSEAIARCREGSFCKYCRKCAAQCQQFAREKCWFKY